MSVDPNVPLRFALILLLASACRSGSDETAPNAENTGVAEPAAANQENATQARALVATHSVNEPVKTLAATPRAPMADGVVRAEIGQAAPDFLLTDFEGREHLLSSCRGKLVVLEWFNPACPVVKYEYDKGPLREMHERYATAGIVWLAINSAAPGKEGADPLENKEFLAQRSIRMPVLVDSAGLVGRSYGAKTTPHMFVINERGVLVYRGGLDNAPQGQVEGSGGKVNYVDAAITDLKSGHAVTTSDTKSYGCSVKYGR